MTGVGSGRFGVRVDPTHEDGTGCPQDTGRRPSSSLGVKEGPAATGAVEEIVDEVDNEGGRQGRRTRSLRVPPYHSPGSGSDG